MSASQTTLNVACVEDHEPDAVLIRESISKSPHMDLGGFYRATDLKGLTSLVNERTFDVLLLDLGLPDSVGLGTIGNARMAVGATPLVVLTGDDTIGVEAIGAGADDFVAKDHMGHGHLARTLAHAVERHRLIVRLAQRESEIELERIGAVKGPGMPVASSLVGSRPLAAVDPGFVRHCEETFARVVLARLSAIPTGEEVDRNRVIETLSRQLAARNAGPDDLVSVLTGTVDAKRGQLRPAQFGPFVRECRLALIEMMGYLVNHYRAHAPLRQVDGPIVQVTDPPSAQVVEIGLGAQGDHRDTPVSDPA